MRLTFILILSVVFLSVVLAQDKLVKLSVVFRHGNRMPILFPYPNNPHKDARFKVQPEMLTEKGAEESVDLGRRLRQKYDQFLSEYDPNQYRAISSPAQRCIETLTNLTTALYPDQKQPLPYTYKSDDKLIATYKSCWMVLDSLVKFEFDNEHDRLLGQLISEHAGMDVKTYLEMMNLYDYLNVMEENDFVRPVWARDLWHDMDALFKKAFNLVSEQQGMNVAGNLLHKIASESSGTKLKTFPKVNLYSGHDINLVSLLGLLGGYKEQDIPYCSYIAFEVYERPNNTNYVQIYFDNRRVERERIPIPGCEDNCPVNTFLDYAEERYLAEEWCT